MHFGIRLKLLFYTLSIILIVAVAITGYSIIKQQESIYQDLVDTAKNQITIFDQVLFEQFYQYRIDKINGLLSSLKKDSEIIDGYALDKNQYILADGDKTHIFSKQRIANLEPYFQNMKNSKATVLKSGKSNFYIGKAVRAPNNDIVGYVVFNVSKQKAIDAVNSAILQTALIFIGLVIAGSVVAMVLTYFYTRPFIKMNQDMQLIAQGDLNHTIDVTTKDERGMLASSINKMIFSLKQINEAISRFVPKQFIEILNKKDISEIKLGDCVQKNLSILFVDIVRFTSASEKMTPRESFEYINVFLANVSPAISQHGGFIDKYLGDGFMAIFLTPPENVIQCGINILETIEKMKSSNLTEKSPAHIGIGLNSGDALLGMVGSLDRMDGTVISSAVNIAARMEELTRVYQVDFLVSEYTYSKLTSPDQFAIRLIDRVQLRGMKHFIKVYEVFDANDQALKNFKLQTRKKFTEAVEAYLVGDQALAKIIFNSIYDVRFNDNVLNFYLRKVNW